MFNSLHIINQLNWNYSLKHYTNLINLLAKHAIRRDDDDDDDVITNSPKSSKFNMILD